MIVEVDQLFLATLDIEFLHLHPFGLVLQSCGQWTAQTVEQEKNFSIAWMNRFDSVRFGCVLSICFGKKDG